MSKAMRVLIIDDEEMMAKTLADILNLRGFSAVAVTSAAAALERIQNETFDLVISDIKMPDMNGVDLYRQIKMMCPEIPVVLMTAYAPEKIIGDRDRERITVMEKPVNFEVLFALARSLQKGLSVVIIDDDPYFCRTLGDLLQAKGFRTIRVTDPHENVVEQAAAGDLVLLDMVLNRVTGLDILRELRNSHGNLPIILVSGRFREVRSEIEIALKSGARTCLKKPVEVEELLLEISRIRENTIKNVVRDAGGKS